jgi:hypothetical protein
MMTGAMIAQLIIALGPVALELIPKLIAIWSTQLTVDQVNSLCAVTKKSYDEYIAAAKAAIMGAK